MNRENGASVGLDAKNRQDCYLLMMKMTILLGAGRGYIHL